ncbi:hypothetical protein ABWK22_02475 [Gottfriedia acidiceleris]|uniref:hypothetical protein n=1 Tax=Gottfriedia acidiceleris TaxID=371036 RepID=UPI003399ABF9
MVKKQKERLTFQEYLDIEHPGVNADELDVNDSYYDHLQDLYGRYCANNNLEPV